MKIAALISGGVDSSVALSLLRREHPTADIRAFYLKIWLEEEFQFLGNCPWEEDLKYARAVCQQLDVPLEVVSLQKEYWDLVVQETIAELKAGYTPSPDIWCNQRIKFGAFYEAVPESFDAIMTGHYAGTEMSPDRSFTALTTSLDRTKDQTYFLSQLRQEQVAKSIFPLGNKTKPEVRALAHDLGLATMDRKDSQGICFLGKIKYRDFVKAHLGTRPGPIIHKQTGKTLGKHEGYWFYTIGQRKGLGLGGGPWFVMEKDIARNILYVANTEDAASEAMSRFQVTDCNWITNDKPAPDETIRVKVRHGAQTFPARLAQQQVELLEGFTDKGIAAGQYCVFYRGDICLGNGKIALPV